MALIALLSAQPSRSDTQQRLTELGHVVVQVLPASPAEGQIAPAVAALACDLVLAEIAADVGIDQSVSELWRWIEQAQVPRAVVITSLAEGRADFDDLTTLAERLLEPAAIATRLPVLDDDERAVASLDLATWQLHEPASVRPSEEGHRSVSSGSRSELLAALAAVVTDDDVAVELLREADSLDADDADLVMLPTPTFGARQESALDVTLPLVGAVGEGLVVPVVAATHDGAWCLDVHGWLKHLHSDPGVRLVQRDLAGRPADAAAAVVLDCEGHTILVRPITGQPAPGPAVLTAPGVAQDGSPTPFRAWPTYLTEPHQVAGQCWRLRTEIQAEQGDTLAAEQVWIMPMPTD